MGQEKETKPEKPLSPLIEGILSIMEQEQDLSLWNGQSKEKVVEILTKTEDLFKTFLVDNNEEPLNEFLDSDPEIADFLTKPRYCFLTGTGHHRVEGSVLSHMRRIIKGE